MKYTVKIAPVTKKNHQQILKNHTTGKPFVAPSPQYQQYEKQAAWFLHPLPPQPIDYPVSVKCLFFLPTRRKTDLTNLLECIDDVLVSSGVLADDNYGVIASHDGSRCYVDKKNPRTEIYIERMDAADGEET